MKTFSQFVENYAEKVAQLRTKQLQQQQVAREKLNAQRQQQQMFVDTMKQEREDAIERKKLKDEIKKELEDNM